MINDEIQEQNSLLDTMRDNVGKAARDISTSTRNLKEFVKSNPGGALKLTILFCLLIILLVWFFFFKLKM